MKYMKIIILLVILFLINTLNANNLTIDYDNQFILINKKEYKLPFISDTLGTIVIQKNDNIILSNEYNASATSKSIENLIIDIPSLKIKQLERITYKPVENLYVGWITKINLPLENLNNDDKFEMFYPNKMFDYKIVDKSKECKEINYKINEHGKSFNYCRHKNISTFNKLYIPIYKFYNNKLDFYKFQTCNNISTYKRLDDFLDCFNTSTKQNIILQKQPLYKIPPEKTKMYLIKGDKVEILKERDDWIYILYKGKKDIKAWIPKNAVE